MPARGVISISRSRSRDLDPNFNLTPENAYAVAGYGAGQKALGGAGIRLVDDEMFETTQTNFAPQFAKIADARPDLLLVRATGAPAVVITRPGRTCIPIFR
jgi:hypothetical protein